MRPVIKTAIPSKKQKSLDFSSTSFPLSNENKSGYSKKGKCVNAFRKNKLSSFNSDRDQLTLNSLITHSINAVSIFSHSLLSRHNLKRVNPNHGYLPYSRSHREMLRYSLSPTRTKIIPPKSKAYMNKKTLVLDLDETLVHSGFNQFLTPSDIVLKIELDNTVHDVHVLIRPGAEEFIERMAKHFELIIFTASLAKYAGPLIDKLDKKRVCSYRLFREHCTMINNAFVKDLKRLDRDFKDLVILDNSPSSYSFNEEIGLPIKSWYDDKADRELYQIGNILEFLAYVPDVRDFICQFVVCNEISFAKAKYVSNNYTQGKSFPKNSTMDKEEKAQIRINLINSNYSNYLINPREGMTTQSAMSKIKINTFRSDSNRDNLEKPPPCPSLLNKYSSLVLQAKKVKIASLRPPSTVIVNGKHKRVASSSILTQMSANCCRSLRRNYSKQSVSKGDSRHTMSKHYHSKEYSLPIDAIKRITANFDPRNIEVNQKLEKLKISVNENTFRKTPKTALNSKCILEEIIPKRKLSQTTRASRPLTEKPTREKTPCKQ